MRLATGAPGIYRASEEMRRTLGNVRMDVCAFIGVAPRGPARIPVEPETCETPRAYVEPDRPRQRSVAVPVESWDEYRRLFGEFDGPGRLPYAVASFFEQGGRRAYIVRIVHAYDNAADNLAAVARGRIDNVDTNGGDIALDARSEGSWGNGLRAGLGFDITPLELLPGSAAFELAVGLGEEYPVGTLLRIRIPQGDGTVATELRFVSSVRNEGGQSQGGADRFLTLASPLPGWPATEEAQAAVRADVITGHLLLTDAAGNSERYANLGLSWQHPNWMATVLYQQSRLVYPVHDWTAEDIRPQRPEVLPLDPRSVLLSQPVLFGGGEDRYPDIEHADFFDEGWVLQDPLPGSGLQAVSLLSDLSAVVIPDLYVPESLPTIERDEEGFAGSPIFVPCDAVPPVQVDPVVADHELAGLLLDPDSDSELREIVRLQKKVVDFCSLLCRFVALLDVPPGLDTHRILNWRSNFRSSYAAAYHPWLRISTLDDDRDRLILVNPSAAAAGIIARQEQLFGVPHGPANTIARGVVTLEERVAPRDHDSLHPLGVNVFLQERDGIWLSAGRTLSRDKRYRQLSVRRLMIMLRRALQQQMHWMVFEPNNRFLWADVRNMLGNYLRQLFVAGAFKGNSEEQAFFVRCDGELNDRRVIDAGQLVCEIGVAPAEPLEFIVVRLTRGDDGTLAVET